MTRADTYLWYGDTGSGKTSQIGEIAEWEFARTGRITRLISADSGWDPLEPKIAKGIIEAWNIQYLMNPFPVLVKLSEGYWPSPAQGKLVMVAPTPATWDRVGQVVIEGLSTISNLLMRDHIRNQRKLKDVSLSEFTLSIDIESEGKVKSVSEKFGQADRSHYQQVQDFVLFDLVTRFATLPVSKVIWTAHEAKGDDDVTGIKNSVLGPATIGKATVGKTAMKFGDTFHFSKSIQDKPGPGKARELVYQAFYEDHPDEVLTRMVWPAKLSQPLANIPNLRKRFPGGFVPLSLTGGMDQFFEFKYGPDPKKEEGNGQTASK